MAQPRRAEPRKRRAAALEKPHAAAVDAIALRYGEEAKWSRVDDVESAMFPSEEVAPEESAIGASTWVAAAWIALRALLHLALRP